MLDLEEFWELDTKYYLNLCEWEEWVADGVFNLPGVDVIFDSYDSSFELIGVPVGFHPTLEQIEIARVVGFHRFWLRYEDGTENYFYLREK